jgi:Bacterial extracellular solute-binding protein, family 7
MTGASARHSSHISDSAGQLGTDLDTFTQVRIGGVQMMVLSNLLTATAAPLGSLPSMPFGLQRYDAVLAGNGRQARQAASRRSLEGGLYDHRQDPRQRLSPDDVFVEADHYGGEHAGFKLHAPPSPLIVSTWRARGAAPTTVNFSEVYIALQTGVVEGQEGPLVYICEPTAVRSAEVPVAISGTVGTLSSIRAPSAACRRTCRIWSWTALIRRASVSETTLPA